MYKYSGNFKWPNSKLSFNAGFISESLIVLVFCCYTTNHPKTQTLKRKTFIISQYLSSGIWMLLMWVLWLKVSNSAIKSSHWLELQSPMDLLFHEKGINPISLFFLVFFLYGSWPCVITEVASGLRTKKEKIQRTRKCLWDQREVRPKKQTK